MSPSVALLTPLASGAIAVISLRPAPGDDRWRLAITPRRAGGVRTEPGALTLVTLCDADGPLDEGLLACVPDERGERWELHLHGGQRVAQRAVAALRRCGLPLATTAAQLREHAPSLDVALAPTARGGLWLAAQAAGALGDPPPALLRRADVLLMGPTNAGKSTLFNALLGQARSIVSQIPGSTRDPVDADADVDGVPVRLVDLAGERAGPEEPDPLEQAALSRQRRWLAGQPSPWDPPDGQALRVALVVVSGASPFPTNAWPALADAASHCERALWVRTHADLPQMPWDWPSAQGVERVQLAVCAHEAEGVDRVRLALAQTLLSIQT